MDKIVDLNARSSSRTSRERIVDALHGGASMVEKWKHPITTCGIWLLASRLNHSCAGNRRASFIGDMQIVRATMDIPAATELLAWYRDPQPLQSYTDVQKEVEKWGFTCECKLCKDRKATPQRDLARRAVLDQLLISAMAVRSLVSTKQVLAVIKLMEETYPLTSTASICLELVAPYFVLGTCTLAAGKLEDGVNMIVQGLEALGYSVRVQLFATKRKKPRLEVERWGVTNELVCWAFTRLSEAKGLAPKICDQAKQYAEITYLMVVGESETMNDTISGSAGGAGTLVLREPKPSTLIYASQQS